MQIMSGKITVGSSLTNLKKFSIIFPTKFASVPTVVANTLTDPNAMWAADTLCVSIISVDVEGAKGQIFRVDTNPPGWGQNLQLGWIAVSNN